jgi:hypothetical protein
LKLDDADYGELGPSTRDWRTRKHPIHVDRVRKAHHHFFDNVILAEGL